MDCKPTDALPFFIFGYKLERLPAASSLLPHDDEVAGMYIQLLVEILLPKVLRVLAGRKEWLVISSSSIIGSAFTCKDEDLSHHIRTAQVYTWIWFGITFILCRLYYCYGSWRPFTKLLNTKFRLPQSTASILFTLSPLRIRSFSVLITGSPAPTLVSKRKEAL